MQEARYIIDSSKVEIVEEKSIKKYIHIVSVRLYLCIYYINILYIYMVVYTRYNG